MTKCFLYPILTVLLTGCAIMPRASVEMSMHLEQQLYALKQANETIISSVFDSKEQAMISYIDNSYFPSYLEELFKNPAIENIWDSMVASKDMTERHDVMLWLNRNAQKEYIRIKDSLLMPIRTERIRVLKVFDEEYDKAIRMNSTITRNIASVSDIQDVYRDFASQFVDMNRIDSIVNNSLKIIDGKLTSVQKGITTYQQNEDKIQDVINKFK